MADSEDMDTGKKKLPQTLPELVWEYKEAMDFATEDHFENLSVWESKGQLDLCGDSSHRGDLNQLYPISQVSTTGIEDGDTIAAGIEHDDTIANSVEMQIPSDDDRSADGIEDDDTNADGIEDDDTNADGIEDDDTYSDSVAMQMLGLDDRNADIMRPDLTWEQMVVKVLHMIRCRELTEYNHKLQIPVTTRFCLFNIALFDLDEESKIKPRPLFRDIPTSDYWMLENSVNVISIKVEVSDVGYPINIFGTVVARDEVDYRCVYLFNRGRDNPQLITSPVDTLTLTGPNRSLAVTDTMYFEFHLKIKDDGAVDKDFCKGLLEHNTVRHTLPTMRLSLESWLSTVKLEFTVVPFAVEASVAVSILKGPSTLNGKIVAWTTGNNEKIVLYDSGVEGTKTEIGTDGFVALTRCIMAVPLDEDLVINVSLGGNDREAECLKFFTGNDVEKCTKMLSPYELQVKIVWRGVIKQRRPKLWEYFGDVRVLR